MMGITEIEMEMHTDLGGYDGQVFLEVGVENVRQDPAVCNDVDFHRKTCTDYNRIIHSSS